MVIFGQKSPLTISDSPQYLPHAKGCYAPQAAAQMLRFTVLERAENDPLQTFDGLRFFAPMTKKIYFAVFLGVALAGCESVSKFALSPVTTDRDQGSCVVCFDVTNTSDGTLPLIYDISSHQN
jgi:hypothetical protein